MFGYDVATVRAPLIPRVKKMEAAPLHLNVGNRNGQTNLLEPIPVAHDLEFINVLSANISGTDVPGRASALMRFTRALHLYLTDVKSSPNLSPIAQLHAIAACKPLKMVGRSTLAL